MKNEYRFEPDGQCTAIAFDFITQFFFDTLESKEEIASIKGLKKMIEFLKKYNLNFFVSLPSTNFLSPKLWGFLVENFYNIKSSKNLNVEINKLVLSDKKHCILFRSNAKRLYNIRGESWRHIVLKYFENQAYKIFDPLQEVFSFQLADVNSDDRLTTRLLIWKII